MKNRRKRKNTMNKVMSIRVLLTRDLHAPIYRHKTDDPIDPEESSSRAETHNASTICDLLPTTPQNKWE